MVHDALLIHTVVPCHDLWYVLVLRIRGFTIMKFHGSATTIRIHI